MHPSLVQPSLQLVPVFVLQFKKNENLGSSQDLVPLPSQVPVSIQRGMVHQLPPLLVANLLLLCYSLRSPTPGVLPSPAGGQQVQVQG